MSGTRHRLVSVAFDAPLRVQITSIVGLLVTIALLVVGLTATSTLRGYLLQRVDDQLQATARDQVRRHSDDGPRSTRPGEPAESGARPVGPALQTAFYTKTVDNHGDGIPELRLPAGVIESSPKLPTLDAATVDKIANRPFTTLAEGKGPNWRLLVVDFPDDTGATVVGTSLSDVDRTVDRLRRIDTTVSISTLIALLVLGYLLVRVRLRRLSEVEQIAEQIAGGDLSRRVPDWGNHNEVGRLAQALNVMLDQIEFAFAAQKASENAARASEDRMRRFVGDASHELRTPLTSIKGFAELFRQRVAAGAQPPTELITRVESEAGRMSALVEDLLLLARLDQQRPLQRDAVDLHELIADAVADAPALGPGHAVTLSVSDAARHSPVIVMGDALRMRQIMTNLLMNAYVHTPDGTHVEVTLDVDESSATIEVKDDGPGLAAEDAERVFERFYRSDPSRARSSGGNGLGLSIVAGLVEAHGGTIQLITAPETGARFVVRLPRVPIDD